MGFNFRKSFRIGKLFRVNIGKSGASVSVGGKGFRQSISTSGNARTTFSIPGTGLSYSKTLSAKKLLKKESNRPVFQSAKGIDPAGEVKAYQEDIALITSLHLYEDYPRGIDWSAVKSEEEPFAKGTDGPQVKEAKALLDAQKPGLFQRVFGGGKALMAELEANLEEAKKADEALYRAWESNKALAEKILGQNKDNYLEALEEVKLSEELGNYVRSLKFAYTDEDSLQADMTLSVTDFIPEQYKTLTPTGKLSVKDYTKTDYYEIASRFVTGLVFRTARNLFNLLPIEDVLMEVSEMEKNKYSGLEEKERILSILIDRSTLEKIDFTEANPFEALTNFRHEVNFVKTKGFTKIEKTVQ